jgi:hypothetical protein
MNENYAVRILKEIKEDNGHHRNKPEHAWSLLKAYTFYFMSRNLSSFIR